MKGTANEVTKEEVGIQPDDHAIGVVNGPGIDKTAGGHYDEASVHIMLNDRGAGGTLSGKVQESDDDGAGDPYADVPLAVITPLVVNNQQAVIRLNLQNRKKFFRVVTTVAGNAIKHAANVSLSQPKYSPTVQTANEVVDADPNG